MAKILPTQGRKPAKPKSAVEMTKIIEIYDVKRWDGGDRHNHDCYFSSEETAKDYLGKDNKYDRFDKMTLVVHDTVHEAREFKNGELKRRALAKLTKEERIALGFS